MMSMIALVLLSSINAVAQIKNQKIVVVKVAGNCEMCKSTIENAARLKSTAQVKWDDDAQIATLSFDSTKTTQQEVLKKIALAGYDNEMFLAPDDTYSKLPSCCQYDRTLKPEVQPTVDRSNAHRDHSKEEVETVAKSLKDGQLILVLNGYFQLKDALVNSDVELSSTRALALTKVISAIDMSSLSIQEHNVWMKVLKNVSSNTASITANKNIDKQREAFSKLSSSISEIAKVANTGSDIYVMHCPMYNGGKGGSWLSKEEQVKNPYYGAQMLTCGVVERKINNK